MERVPGLRNQDGKERLEDFTIVARFEVGRVVELRMNVGGWQAARGEQGKVVLANARRLNGGIGRGQKS